MNGSAHSSASSPAASPSSSSDVVDIKLTRGPAGLGFNIVGGVDQQYVLYDNGIYVSKIKEDGAAALDGRLEEGDKILAINGTPLEDLAHRSAVEFFRTAGEDVELRVQKKPHHMNGPRGSKSGHESSMSPLAILAVVAGTVAIGAFLYMRHIRKWAH